MEVSVYEGLELMNTRHMAAMLVLAVSGVLTGAGCAARSEEPANGESDEQQLAEPSEKTAEMAADVVAACQAGPAEDVGTIAAARSCDCREGKLCVGYCAGGHCLGKCCGWGGCD
jgi:hypothetical protein